MNPTKATVRIPAYLDLVIVAVLSAVIVLVVLIFAAVDASQRTAGAFALGAIGLLGLAASVFGIFLRGVDERLFRVSEYRQSQYRQSQHHPSQPSPRQAGDSMSTLWDSSTL